MPQDRPSHLAPAGRVVRLVALLAVLAPPALAQQAPAVQDTRLDTRRAQATRQELQASLAQIDTILNSPGYSSRIREAKRREASLIRERLVEGDIQVGDQIVLTVIGEETFSQTFTVGSGRVLSLPGIPDIPLRGILRSEAQAHLTEQIGRYIREPRVRVEALIRMGILGAVGRQGFYQVPADQLVSDAIMLAGGLSPAADPNRTMVRRGGVVILANEDVQEAIIRGATLDQLNLRAGDEIVVDPKLAQRGRTLGVVGAISLVTSVAFLITRIF